MRLSLPMEEGDLKQPVEQHPTARQSSMSSDGWHRQGLTGFSLAGIISRFPFQRPLRDLFVGRQLAEFKDEAQPSWVIAFSDAYHPLYRCECRCLY